MAITKRTFVNLGNVALGGIIVACVFLGINKCSSDKDKVLETAQKDEIVNNKGTIVIVNGDSVNVKVGNKVDNNSETTITFQKAADSLKKETAKPVNEKKENVPVKSNKPAVKDSKIVTADPVSSTKINIKEDSKNTGHIIVAPKEAGNTEINIEGNSSNSGTIFVGDVVLNLVVSPAAKDTLENKKVVDTVFVEKAKQEWQKQTAVVKKIKEKKVIRYY